MSITNPTIPNDHLDAAVAAFPDWLADDVRTEIRTQEERGVRFASAAEAVAAALEILAGE